MIYSDKLAIVIPACDKYLDIFSEYMRYFKTNWSDCPFELILVTEEKKYNDERVTSITTSSQTNWTGRVLAGVAQTNCKYILTSIEDGFISQKVNTTDLFEIIDFMDKHAIKYYRNPKDGHKRTKENMFEDFEYACKLEKNGVYSRTLGIDIWNREALIELFGDGTKSAWDIENYFLEYAVTAEKGYFEDWVSDKRNFLHIIETVSGGKWMITEIKRFDKLGMPVNVGNRPVTKITDYFRRRLHAFMNAVTQKCLRKPIKKLVAKFGYKFGSMN